MQGDWQGLMAQHNHSVVLALLARGVPLNQAKELAHDAWTRLFEAHLAGKFSGLALPGLAIRQALFLAATQRKARRWTAVPVEDAAQLADCHATPDTRVELRQLLARTQTATAELSAGCVIDPSPYRSPAPKKGGDVEASGEKDRAVP